MPSAVLGKVTILVGISVGLGVEGTTSVGGGVCRFAISVGAGVGRLVGLGVGRGVGFFVGFFVG